jgi:phage-related protein
MPEDKGGGLLRRAFGASPGAIATGDNVLQARNRALQHTSPDSPGPAQPQNIVGLKTVPTLQQPRVWTAEEAERARVLAAQMREGVKYSKQGYDALKSVDDSEVKIEAMHYDYLGHLAENEAERIRSRVGYVNKLSRLHVTLNTLEAKSVQIHQQSLSRLEQRKQEIRAKMSGRGREKQPALVGG